MSVKLMTAVTNYGPQNSSQRFVLLMIADNAADDGSNSFPSVETLANKTALSERTVIRAIEGLVDSGYLIRRRRRNTSNLYQMVLSKIQAPVSDNLSSTISDNLSLTDVTWCHLGTCQDVTHEGDTMSPDPSINHPINHPDQPKATATAPAAEPSAAPVAVAAVPADPDPIPPILDWIGFDDALTPRERTALNPPILLAWAYWVKLKTAERAPRVHNPVGLVRAQWRKGVQPRADLLRLARGWLALDDDARGRLLGRLEWATDYGQYDPGDPLDDEFPDIPLATAAAVFAATGGQLAPPRLMPVCGADRPTPAPDSTSGPGRSVGQTAQSPLWKTALADLEMQMTRDTFAKWLKGTTAIEDEEALTIHVANDYAIDWLANRLQPLIERTVRDTYGRPLTIHYEARQ